MSMQRHKERERKTDMFLSLALALAATKTNLILRLQGVSLQDAVNEVFGGYFTIEIEE